MNKVSPSILAADFGILIEQILEIEKAGCEMLHIDVMDGHFVPNISFGLPIINSIKKHTNIPLDVHLMVTNAEQIINGFIDVQPYNITVHVEAVKHLDRLINLIKSNGIKASVALNPSTPLTSLDYILENVDMVLIMTVNPGYGGQSFIKSMYKKISDLKNMINTINRDIDIQVDGGVGEDNVKSIMEVGANVIVTGSAIFEAESIERAVKKIKCPV